MEKVPNKDVLSYTPRELKTLRKSLKNLLGFRTRHLDFYIAAFTHRSISESVRSNNERLEYLGDAVIGVIVGDYLFKKYPDQDEGFLTEMRSKIVSRNSLNNIARRMGLQDLLKYNHSDKPLGRSQIFGNALEAFVGATYLDVGFEKTRKFLLRHILDPYINIDQLENTEYNFKNKIYSWAQRQDIRLNFKTVEESSEGGRKVFTVAILTPDKELGRGTGYSKKEAGQIAAQKALESITEENV